MRDISNFYSREMDKVSREFPSLISKFEKDHWELTGVLAIVDASGVKHDEFEVQIIIPPNFPRAVPKLFELGGRIKRNADFHINPDGSCCLSIPAKEVIILRNGISTVEFLKKLAIPFLANHTYREKYGEYAAGEYSHGLSGIIEFYFEVFDTKDITIVILGLEALLLKKVPGPNKPCFCGDQKKFKKCHREGIDLLTIVPMQILVKDHQDIISAIREYYNQKSASKP